MAPDLTDYISSRAEQKRSPASSQSLSKSSLVKATPGCPSVKKTLQSPSNPWFEMQVSEPSHFRLAASTSANPSLRAVRALSISPLASSVDVIPM